LAQNLLFIIPSGFTAKLKRISEIKCNLNSLRKIYVRYKPYYEITGVKGKDTEDEIIRMDFYQYEKLLKKTN
jgi:hypothetical protein